ncbi:MAG: aldehyde dehydrogenase family protein [Acidobacteriota bacterium]|nr:aldehyde dehydrogenase family protein [Acidobacteriota bacterium]
MVAVLTSGKTSEYLTEEVVSYNPATGAEIGRVPNESREAVFAAVGRARAAFKVWRATSFADRKKIVLKAREVILSEMDEIARLISEEMGKPIAEAFSTEISPVLDLMQYFARNTQKLLKPEKINLGQFALLGRSSRIVYQPLGVVGIISPWNYPLAIPLGEVAMALMAGNTVVLKPSELTPFVGLKIGEGFKKAGLPENVLQVVTGDGRTGAALVEAGVNKIMFTGSVATGKKIAEAAARNLTPVVLELGGKDPMIVLEDANLETAAQAAVWGAFANAGQTCASVERLYVHEKIAPEFIEKVVELTKKLRQNIGTGNEAEIGSMVSERQLETVENHVRDAREKGAKILTGGKRNENFSGAFFEPTVLTNVDHNCRAVREETFGPTLPIMTFKTEDEAVRLANDSEFGLTASVWTKNIGKGKRIAGKIEAGTVTVNEVVYTHGLAQTPWGGVKNSGYGRTHGKLGLMELVTPQHIHVNRITQLPDVWWFNYSPDAINLFRGLARYFSAGSVFKTTRILPQMLRRIKEHRRK